MCMEINTTLSIHFQNLLHRLQNNLLLINIIKLLFDKSGNGRSGMDLADKHNPAKGKGKIEMCKFVN